MRDSGRYNGYCCISISFFLPADSAVGFKASASHILGMKVRAVKGDNDEMVPLWVFRLGGRTRQRHSSGKGVAPYGNNI